MSPSSSPSLSPSPFPPRRSNSKSPRPGPSSSPRTSLAFSQGTPSFRGSPASRRGPDPSSSSSPAPEPVGPVDVSARPILPGTPTAANAVLGSTGICTTDVVAPPGSPGAPRSALKRRRSSPTGGQPGSPPPMGDAENGPTARTSPCLTAGSGGAACLSSTFPAAPRVSTPPSLVPTPPSPRIVPKATPELLQAQQDAGNTERAGSLAGDSRSNRSPRHDAAGARDPDAGVEQEEGEMAEGEEKDDRTVMPRNFEDARVEDIIVLVADMLSRLVAHNDLLPLHPSNLTRFHSRATPTISIVAYLHRIARYTNIEKSCLLILLVYIDRVCERLEGFTICGLTVHRFVCVSVVVASKALCDAFSTNSHYARVGGISMTELNVLEKEFCRIIDWRLTCPGALLQHYYHSLVRSHAAYRLERTPAPSRSASRPRSVSPSLSGMSEDTAAAEAAAVEPVEEVGTVTRSDAGDRATKATDATAEDEVGVSEREEGPSDAAAAASVAGTLFSTRTRTPGDEDGQHRPAGPPDTEGVG